MSSRLLNILKKTKEYWIKKENSKYVWGVKNGITTYLVYDMQININDDCMGIIVAVFNDSFHVDLKNFLIKLSLKYKISFLDENDEPTACDEYEIQ